jgi:hypothetical protein
MSAKIDVSYGDLFDKVSILEIKANRLADPAKQRNVEQELAQLLEVCRAIPGRAAVRDQVLAQLKAVNAELWDVEDALRGCEHARSFGPTFVELARSVYRLNDRRSALKRQINAALGSSLVEEKLYTDY